MCCCIVYNIQTSIDLARAKSEAVFNIYNFLKENIKSSNTKEKVKTTRTTIATLLVEHTFLNISLLLFYTTKT